MTAWIFQMVTLVASWFPDRKLLLLVDSLYSGKSVLSKLPANVDLIGSVHPKAALYEVAPAPNRLPNVHGSSFADNHGPVKL